MSRTSAPYCAVTVVCQRRRLDVALPAALPMTDLLPALLRLLLPSTSLEPATRWQLAPTGRPALMTTDTLEGAGVLAGEVLLLEPVAVQGPPAPTASVRDQLEEEVHRLDRAWTGRTSARFLLWLSAAAGAALLVPAAGFAWFEGSAGFSGGLPMPMQLSVAAVLAAAAIAAAGRAGEAAAAACLLAGCGWAALAGWGASSAGGPVAAVAGAAVAALLLAVAALLGYPGAVVHGGAVGVVVIAAGVAGIAAAVGAPPPDILTGLAVIAVLAVGAAPRVVLAATGLSPAGPGRTPQPLAARFARADRLLVGVLIGLSAVAAASALPAAFAGDAINRVFAAVIAAALLLRSRAFSQTPHALPERVAGVAVLATVGAGWYAADPGLRSVLLLLPVVLVAVLAAAAGLTTSMTTAVARARAARVLDLAEQLMVVTLIVLATGLLGGFGWVATALG